MLERHLKTTSEQQQKQPQPTRAVAAAAAAAAAAARAEAAVYLDEVVITSSDNDVGTVLSEADSIHIVLVGLYPHACLHHHIYNANG